MSRASRLLFGSIEEQVSGLASSLAQGLQRIEQIATHAEATGATLASQRNLLTNLQASTEGLHQRQGALDKKVASLAGGVQAIAEVRNVVDGIAAQHQQLMPLAGLAALPGDVARLEASLTMVTGRVDAVSAPLDEMNASAGNLIERLETLHSQMQTSERNAERQLAAFKEMIDGINRDLAKSVDEAMVGPVETLQRKVSQIDKSLLTGVSSIGASVMSLRDSMDRQAAVLAELKLEPDE